MKRYYVLCTKYIVGTTGIYKVFQQAAIQLLCTLYIILCTDFILKIHRFLTAKMPIKHLLCTLYIILCTNFCFAQKERTIWRFGEAAGIDFSDTAKPLAYIPDSAGKFNKNIVTSEDGATICDKITGELLFYSDGLTIWNKKGDTLLNRRTALGGCHSVV